MKQEVHDDPAAASRRQEAARQRAAQERLQRVTKAIAKLAILEEHRREEDTKMEQAKAKTNKAGKTEEKKSKEPRGSTADVDANVMKMADGGYHPAYNGQFVTDTETGMAVGVDVSTMGNDMGLMK